MKNSKYPGRQKSVESWFKLQKPKFEKGVILAYNKKSIFSKIAHEKNIADKEKMY